MSRSTTREEFEALYAAHSGQTLLQLYRQALFPAIPCDCTKPDCHGWTANWDNRAERARALEEADSYPDDAPTPGITLQDIGPTEAEAIRALLVEFRAREWTDDGAARAIVGALSRIPLRVTTAVQRVPTRFLTHNSLEPSDVEAVIARLATRRSR